MAYSRCGAPHIPKNQKYFSYVHPVGYPLTGLICGLCEKPGLIWLDNVEEHNYIRGQRIFPGPNNDFAQMKADDAGIRGNRNNISQWIASIQSNLIKCRGCEKEVVASASKCPHCGTELPAMSSASYLNHVLWLSLCVIIMGILAYFSLKLGGIIR